MLPADGRCRASCPIELATSRQPTSASSTDSGSAPPAYVAPSEIDSATAPAGAIDVTAWNRTSRRPMAPRARPAVSWADFAWAMAAPFADGSRAEIPAIPVIKRDLGNCKTGYALLKHLLKQSFQCRG